MEANVLILCFDRFVVVCATSPAILCPTVAQQQQNCGYIGDNVEVSATPSREKRFYLNTAKPAPFNGIVRSWRVCYYRPRAFVARHWATFAVYRRTSSSREADGDVADVREADVNFGYERVSPVFRTVRKLFQIRFTQDGFHCYDEVGGSPLTVQKGDVIGACVFDPEDTFIRHQLDVVSRVNPSAGSLLQMGTTVCDIRNIPPDFLATSNSSTILGRRLHIYANIHNNTIVCPPTLCTSTAATTTSCTASPSPVTTTASPPTTTTASPPVTTTIASPPATTTASPPAITTTASLSRNLSTTPGMSSILESVLASQGQAADARVMVGSTCAALGTLLIIISVAILIAWVHKCKRQMFNFSTNVAYHKRHAQDEPSQSNYCEVVTDQNIAYEPSQVLELNTENSATGARGRKDFMLGRLVNETCSSFTSLPVPYPVSSGGRLQEDRTSNFEYDYIA